MMIHAWASWYAHSAAVRTLVSFTHIVGLVVGGGCAIVADRAMLRAHRQRVLDRAAEIEKVRGAHAVVIGGLAAVTVSGVLLFAADLDTFLHSRFFWMKMGLVAVLFANGALIRLFERRAAMTDRHWRRLVLASGASLALWLITTLAGAALPNL
jgi:uncharacterized membrane protein